MFGSDRRGLGALAAPAPLGSAERLSRATRSDDSSEFARGRAHREKRTDEEIKAHGMVARLHLCDTRLARLDQLGELCLGKAPPLSSIPEIPGERNLHLHKMAPGFRSDDAERL